jgi:FKBP-type peptidyl-prolyl cis-trans isomerase
MARATTFLAMLVVLLASCDGPTEGNGPAAAEGCAEGDQIATDSGLVYVDIRCGRGDVATGGIALIVHYVGRLKDGTVFDSSRSRGEPFHFLLGRGQVIPGWDEGVQGMAVGGVREMRIPPDLAYGDAGSPPAIPPDATLAFEVELLEVQAPPD